MNVEDWNCKYIEAINHAKYGIKKIQGIITAFNVNVDAVHFVKSEELKRILTDPKVLEETLRCLKSPSSKIETSGEFIAGLVSTMKVGRGCEWPIYKRDVFQWIQANFSMDEIRMGGQAGIATNVLAELDVPNIYPHAAQLPRMQAELFVDRMNVKIPCREGGDIVFRRPSLAARPLDDLLIHWIFEFDKGVKVEIGDEIFETPHANRFIATWDEHNARLELDPAFEEGSFKVIKKVDKALVSGFHLLRKKYSDGSAYKECLERVIGLLAQWKRANPHLRIHYEQCFFNDLEIMKTVCDNVFPFVDALGLNEDEVALMLKAYGRSSLAERILERYSASILFEGAEEILRISKLNRIIVHTRDFALSLLKPEYQIKPKTEQYALLFGASVAATRALTGKFGGWRDIKETVTHPALHTSDIGLSEHSDLAEKLEHKGITAYDEFLKTGIAEGDEYSIVYVPTKITTRPLSIVGLGDCITAGALIGETEQEDS